jgi:hypothetical protein
MAVYVKDKDGKIIAGLNPDSANFDKYKAEYESKGYTVDAYSKPDNGNKKPNKPTSYSSNQTPLDTDSRGWYVTPEGKHLNPKFYDEYGNRITGGSSSGGSSSSGYGDIDDMYDEQRKALLAQLRSQISQARAGYQDIISKAPQTYQPLRNQTELSREQQLAAMMEALANQGNRGGTGRQALLDINTAAGNRMNEINLQQQNVVNQANQAIANLEQQGKIQESQITADLAAQKLQEIIAQQQRAAEMEAEQERWRTEFEAQQTQQEFENQLKQQQYQNQLAAQQLEREIASLGAYSNDYMAEIQRRQGTADKTDDALIPFLQAARNEKIARQLAEADNTAQQAYKNAYELWKQLGVATADIARILNIPVGAKTIDKIKADYSTNKPYYNPNTGGSGGYGLNW